MCPHIDRYGFSSHDGVGYAVQPIEDRQNQVVLTTSFLKGGGADDGDNVEGSWAVRVSASPLGGEDGNGAPSQELSLFFYFGIEDEYAPPHTEQESYLGEGASADRGGGEYYTLEGRVAGLGKFSVLASGRGANGERLPLTGWTPPAEAGGRAGGGAGGGDLNVRSLIVDALRGGDAAAAGGDAAAADGDAAAAGGSPRLVGGASSRARLLVIQLTARPPFNLELAYAAGGCDDKPDLCEALRRRLSGDALSARLSARESVYRSQVDRRFRLSDARGLGGAPKLSESSHAFGRAALAAALGSFGYFYGDSTVSGAGGLDVRSAAAPLFALVPSRPFFPRGFLWDDGFHQLLVGAFAPSLADDALAHWLGLMHEDGWIPREQILGAEARSRVPSEFLKQHRMHANPPTLLLRLQAELARRRGARAAAPPLPRLYGRMLPKLQTWFEWLKATQSGSRAHSFRWRGRDPDDPRDNALTLSSGLDDYPRATTASDSERHVDLHSWAAFFARVLSELAGELGEASLAHKYAEEHKALVGSLVDLHWNPKLKAFCDWGVHANRGAFKPFVVIKCASADGAASVEVDAPDPRTTPGWKPKCPRTHPQFMYPLGDGAGGLLTRERFVPNRGALKQQWVEHLGYVSLFPLVLRLLPADAPQLAHLLELIGDEQRLWSPYGLRSLSKADRMFQKENAPGDAPYWRGPIWINLNYLVLGGLHHYAQQQGPHQPRAAALYEQLRTALLSNMQAEWERTGYFWEQYDPHTGKGMRTHPFNGWSSLALLALAEVY